jgi:hypothetical protein
MASKTQGKEIIEEPKFSLNNCYWNPKLSCKKICINQPDNLRNDSFRLLWA